MNITYSEKRFRLERGRLTNLKTNETVSLKHTPDANAVAYMSEKEFVRKCEAAMIAGTWVGTDWKSGRHTD